MEFSFVGFGRIWFFQLHTRNLPQNGSDKNGRLEVGVSTPGWQVQLVGVGLPASPASVVEEPCVFGGNTAGSMMSTS